MNSGVARFAYLLGALLATPVLIGTPTVAAAEPQLSVERLLEQVRRGRSADAAVNERRIAEFRSARDDQARLLAEAEAERKAAEQQSEQLEQEFERNDAELDEQEVKLGERLGALKEVFGVLQQFSGDARGQFQSSPTQLQFPERTAFLDQFIDKLGRSTRLASTEDIERLWFELQREVAESGRIVRFSAPVVSVDGQVAERSVTRIGAFNLIADGAYLEWLPETGKLVTFPRQPGRHQPLVAAFEAASQAGGDGLHPVALDPARGRLLSLLVERPDLRERIEQGGIVGYVIIGLGALALLIALERLVRLHWLGARIRRQLARPDEPGANPLGRVLAVYRDHRQLDVEALELKLSEAILRELPAITRRQTALKVIAMVAPLLGLLGTVVGMILTFQAITLFGAGDPKLMAGGISTALVTTVMGLCVAIPTLLLHTLVAAQAKGIGAVLEEQATGLVAEHAESVGAAGAGGHRDG